jgi:hypothetical protein
MVKYAARHWAHYECWLQARGAQIQEPWIYQGILQALEGLHAWQLKQMPIFRFADWLKMHDTKTPKEAGKTWTDKACWLLKKAIQLQEVKAPDAR